ncbi:hypothetical protein ACLOJK_014862, partial [Asimina triloba]
MDEAADDECVGSWLAMGYCGSSDLLLGLPIARSEAMMGFNQLLLASDLMKEVGHLAVNDAGGLLAADGQTVGAIWGRCPSLSRRRLAAGPLAAAGVGKNGGRLLGKMEYHCVVLRQGMAIWCSFIK